MFFIVLTADLRHYINILPNLLLHQME